MTRNAGKLARAVRVLLEMSEADPGLSLELVWDLIENAVSKAELWAALAAIDELVPQADPEFDSQRLEELAGRFATVRAFLPAMMRTIEFGATGGAGPVLKAMHTLADLISPQRNRGRPARWLDARRVDHDLVGGGWQRLVYPAERPEKPWTGPRTRCACSSNSGGICATATSSPRNPPNGATREHICCRGWRGRPPVIQA